MDLFSGLVGVLFILLVFPHTSKLFSVCCSLLVFHRTSGLCLGLVNALLVFPHAIDLFSGLVGVPFVLLIFP